MPNLEITAALVGKEVVSSSRPEWGTGRVLKVVPTQNQGEPAHRVQVHFDIRGTRWLMIPRAKLQLPQAEVEREIVVENDLYRLVLTNVGARVRSWKLKEYRDPNGNELELIPCVVEDDAPMPLRIDLDQPMDTIRSVLSKYPVATRLLLTGRIVRIEIRRGLVERGWRVARRRLDREQEDRLVHTWRADTTIVLIQQQVGEGVVAVRIGRRRGGHHISAQQWGRRIGRTS